MTEPRESRRTVGQAAVGAVVLGCVWILFVAACLSDFVGLAWANHRPGHIGGRNVIIGGVLVGRVELYNLIGGRTLNVYFHPANGDLNVINQYGLNWWQAVNRPEEPGVPDHMDTQNITNGLANANPGDDNDPSYYTNAERTPHNGAPSFNPNQIFSGGNWWMKDAPGDHINIRFETWLVTSGGFSVKRLVCFNWGFTDGGGVVTNTGNPTFVNGSVFNLGQTLPDSGFGSGWNVGTIGPLVSVAPIPTIGALGIIVLVLLMLAGGLVSVLRQRSSAPDSSR